MALLLCTCPDPANCRLSEDAAQFYAAQLALALGYLHSKAIVFRCALPPPCAVKLHHFMSDVQGYQA